MADQEDVVVRVPPAVNKGGTWVKMGLEEYRIPPLGFRAIQDLQANISILQGMTGMPNEAQMKIVADVVCAAMKRNYPDITTEAVLDMLDLGNFQPVFSAVMGASGYRKAESGEVPATNQ